MPGRFDQIVYGTTRNSDSGGDGVASLATSLNLRQREKWFVRLKPLATGQHPVDSLCYYVFDDGKAVLLHRTPVLIGRSEMFVHALIGPCDELTPKLALGSYKWDWDGALASLPNAAANENRFRGKELGALSQDQFQSFQESAVAGWEGAVKNGPHPAALARLISEIRKRGGATGQHEAPLPSDDATLLTLGVRDFALVAPSNELVVGPADRPDKQKAGFPIEVLARLLYALDRDETRSRDLIGSGFSTYESRYYSRRTALPRWVFAPSLDSTSGETFARLLINLRETDSVPHEQRQDDANRLIKGFRAALERNSPGASAEPPTQQITVLAQVDVPASPDENQPQEPGDAQAAGYGKAVGETLGDPGKDQFTESNIPHGEAKDKDDPGPETSQLAEAESDHAGTGGEESPVDGGSVGTEDQLAGDNEDLQEGAAVPSGASDFKTPESRQIPEPARVDFPQPQGQPRDFSAWSDGRLLDEIKNIDLSELPLMTRELKARAGRGYQNGGESDRNLMSISAIRAKITNEEFYARNVNYFILQHRRIGWHALQQVTELFAAMCALALSDQPPGKVSPEAEWQLASVLASNYAMLTDVGGGIYRSPLAVAISEALWAQPGNPPVSRMPYETAERMAAAFLHQRLRYLRVQVGDPPPPPATAAQSVEAPAKRAPRMQRHDVVLLLLALVVVVLVAVVVGWA
jgi:hypothetical protein